MPNLSGLALARTALDRRAEHRSDRELAAYWADPRARVLPLVRGQAPVRLAERGTAPAQDDHEVVLAYQPTSVFDGIAPFFLGVDADQVPYFAIELDSTEGARLPGDARLTELREVGFRLNALDAGAYVHARALVQWHRNHPYCAACGARTESTEGGHVRRCPACAAQHFPRTDPAIIVLVTDRSERALLARNVQWPENRFSTIAGFVEPGESLEAAVLREVHEETGVEVVEPEYAGSQPWPFPASLMLGFFARAVSERITVDEHEIAEARWFTRHELGSGYESGELAGPTPGSIAGRLIQSWLEPNDDPGNVAGAESPNGGGQARANG